MCRTPLLELMIFFYTTKVEFSLISKFSLTPFVLTTKRHPSDVEPSYIPIFWLIQSAVYSVGMSKDCFCFAQMIDYNFNGFSSKLMLIIAFWHLTTVPNFSWIGVQVCELQRFFKCAKRRKKTSKLLTYISETLCVRFSSNLVCSLLW